MLVFLFNQHLFTKDREDTATKSPLRSFLQIKALFSTQPETSEIELSVRQFLEECCQPQSPGNTNAGFQLLVERLETLLCSDDPLVKQLALRWLFDDFIKQQRLTPEAQMKILPKINMFREPWLAYPLLEWSHIADYPIKADIYSWIAVLQYPDNAAQRMMVIESLFNRLLHSKHHEAALLSALKRLDALHGEVTDLALHSFPAKQLDANLRIIMLLGALERYRVVKPLITFCQEYPDYLRPVMKALARFNYDDVDQFYLRCLDKRYTNQPMVLIEGVKQVRKRRLRKAIPLLDDLFPLEDGQALLINRAVNGEIALTMASFGVYAWAREKLLPEMMLNGINQKYLKAVDMLNLDEAVPLLKAIMLAPDTPEMSLLQQQAYQICERLLTSNRPVSRHV